MSAEIKAIEIQVGIWQRKVALRPKMEGSVVKDTQSRIGGRQCYRAILNPPPTASVYQWSSRMSVGLERSKWAVLGLALLFGFSESVSETNLILSLDRM